MVKYCNLFQLDVSGLGHDRSRHHHHHHPSQLKTFDGCQLSLEVILFIMATETLPSLVQGYDSSPTVSLPTFPSHMWLWAVTYICVWLSALSVLSQWRDRKGACGGGPPLGCLTTFHRAPCSQHHNSHLLSYVLSSECFSFLFNHWAFAHATSAAWNTLPGF